MTGHPLQLKRIRLLLGDEAVARLRRAHVAVVGLGAVGSFAAEALARAGIGSLRLVDFDRIHETNINRQLLALHSTIGQPKAELARQRVLDINPECRVEALNLFSDPETRPRILDGPPDALIDAIDSLGPKGGLLQDAVNARVPLIVSSMGAALRADTGAVHVADISETSQCRLAQKIRKRLRKQGITRGIRCVYSTEPPRAAIDFEEEEVDERVLKRGRKRSALGSLPTLTAIFGLTAAHEVILSLARGKPCR